MKRHTRNPMEKIGWLLNQFHAIEHMNMSELEKSQAKELIRKEVAKEGKKVAPRLRTMLKEAFKSKEIWEDLKNTYL